VTSIASMSIPSRSTLLLAPAIAHATTGFDVADGPAAQGRSERLFLRSLSATESAYSDEARALEWLREQNNRVEVRVERISFDRMHRWRRDGTDGAIRHETGKFFSIEGIRVTTTWGRTPTWDQPIINQPEIGYLGFIVKELGGVLHFLTQAKVEPGNINHVQLSPTIQATRSNYTQVHQGRRPLYLEYFQSARPSSVLLDQLQSEQGARFLQKRNRNIIILVDHDVPIYESFTWLTLGQLKRLMRHDNVVNMDTRTVLSGVSYGSHRDDALDLHGALAAEGLGRRTLGPFCRSALSHHHAVHSIDDIIHFLTELKSSYDLSLEKIPLCRVNGWGFSPQEIARPDGKYFKVIAADVSIGNREVMRWQQPMIQPSQPGLCAFVCKELNGVMHFAVQAKLECGNRDVVELAPTVQCLTGDYRAPDSEAVPFIDCVLNAAPEQIVVDAQQSEEGGRFYREQNRNVIVLADQQFPEQLPPRFIWMTLNQLLFFIKLNNYLNIQARSLIAAVAACD